MEVGGCKYLQISHFLSKSLTILKLSSSHRQVFAARPLSLHLLQAIYLGILLLPVAAVELGAYPVYIYEIRVVAKQIRIGPNAEN
jgi:hypothetical protein